ncbi:MAG TPA: hypothetical protein VKC60_05610 [Opitutaceae bacterium]|nr:hypothetical protein [Opitutaceae bacterium]
MIYQSVWIRKNSCPLSGADQKGFISEGRDVFDLRLIIRNSFLLIRSTWTKCNDLYLNIETIHPRSETHAVSKSARPWWFGPISEEARHGDNHAYTSPDYWYVRKVIGILKPGPDDVFYDIGSGKGRIICLVARTAVQKCVGIELLKPLCELAARNALSLHGKRAKVEILCSDAASADLSEGTLYFMFNPFGPATLSDTLENIGTSLARNPRQIKIVYYNPVHESILKACPWLEKFREFRTLGGLRVTFWRSLVTEVVKLGNFQ